MKEIYFVKSGNLSCKVETYSYKLAVIISLINFFEMENISLGKIISARKKGKGSYLNETFFETTFILSQYFNIKQNENSKSNEI